jgi:hypothetical protein
MDGPLATQRSDGLPQRVLRPAPDRRRHRDGGSGSEAGFARVLQGAEERDGSSAEVRSDAAATPHPELGFGEPEDDETGRLIDLAG